MLSEVLIPHLLDTLSRFWSQKRKFKFCREIILSEISYNLNLLSILDQNKDKEEEFRKEILPKILGRLKTDAYEAVVAAGKPLSEVFSKEMSRKEKAGNDFDKRAVDTYNMSETQYELIDNIYQKTYVLKTIGEENLSVVVNEKSRIGFARSLMRLAVDNLK